MEQVAGGDLLGLSAHTTYTYTHTEGEGESIGGVAACQGDTG
jgi:hypothetical protein